jgi:hypothetical protein
MKRPLPFLAAGLAMFAGAAGAHSFGTIYNLPVPFWMYAYGAAAALVVSFVIVGYFVNAKSASVGGRTYDPRSRAWLDALTGPRVRAAARAASVALLLLTIATGLFGSRSAYLNFNMTFFWIIFVLGFTYLTAIVGDVFAVVSPWRVLCDWAGRLRPGLLAGRVRYPERLAYYPALALYIAFIWVELFARTQPRSLSILLIVYTVLNLVAAWLVGAQAWFRYGEFFSVFLRIVAKIAPFESERGRIVLRQPFMGLVKEQAEHFSLLLFILFMLSSTAYDGVHETLPWVQLFWRDIYPLLTPLAAGRPQPYLYLVDFYYYWQWLSLVASPFFYLAIYLFFIALAKLFTRSPLSLRELALRFAYSLVPIAFVYNVTHYYTLIVSQGFSIVRIASDPFGVGWNLLGTASWLREPVVLDAGSIWHTQVWLILFGHIVSVYLAHVEALRVFPKSRQAIASQLPMLVLMVLFTTIGLWILSLPIASGAVVQPPPAT